MKLQVFITWRPAQKLSPVETRERAAAAGIREADIEAAEVEFDYAFEPAAAREFMEPYVHGLVPALLALEQATGHRYRTQTSILLEFEVPEGPAV